MEKINFKNGQAPYINDINLNKMQENIEQEIKGILQKVFPVGSTYTTQTDTNPDEILGFGTWERLKGKLCIGLDEDDADFDTIGKTGGTKEHSHTLNNAYGALYFSSGGIHYNFKNLEQNFKTGVKKSLVSDYVGEERSNSRSDLVLLGSTDNSSHLQPYEVVGYMWIRRT